MKKLTALLLTLSLALSLTACGGKSRSVTYTMEQENQGLKMTDTMKLDAKGDTVQKLEEAGITCVEIKQHSSVLHSPTKLLKEKILSGQFAYDENRLLEINFQNARCTEDTNLNKYVNKKKSSGKVDMVVATINAMYLLQQDMMNNNGFVAMTF